jgi:N-acetylglutamate synthase-like GNAT family acetyltransferase
MNAIRGAGRNERRVISTLLRNHGLRAEGVLDPRIKYWVLEEDNRGAGAIGLELGRTGVRLRSAIVPPDLRGKCLGRDLTTTALNWARTQGYRFACCFTTDAGEYWTARGFGLCSVHEVVDEFQEPLKSGYLIACAGCLLKSPIESPCSPGGAAVVEPNIVEATRQTGQPRTY